MGRKRCYFVEEVETNGSIEIDVETTSPKKPQHEEEKSNEDETHKQNNNVHAQDEPVQPTQQNSEEVKAEEEVSIL